MKLPLPKKQKLTEAGGRTATEIKKLADDAFLASQEARTKYMVTDNFVEGNQWVRSSPSDKNRLVSETLDRRPDDNYPRVTHNIMGPSVARKLARLGMPLAFDVTPLGGDDVSREAARLSANIVEQVRREHRWDDLDRDVIRAGVTGGTAAVWLTWDGRANGMGFDEFGKEWGLGEVRFGTADLSNFAIQPGPHAPEKGHYWVLRQALPPEEVQDLYGLDSPPKADAQAWGTMAFHNGQSAVSGLTQVTSFFERPHGKRKGGIWTVVGGEVVEYTAWPFPFNDELNLETFRPVVVPRTWIGSTPVWGAVPLQREHNQHRSHALAHLRDLGSAKLVVDSTFDEDLDDGPGVLRVTPDPSGGFQPYYLSPPGLPGWISQYGQTTQAAIFDAVGDSEILSGRAPAGVSSGTALAALIEQATGELHPSIRERARMWGRLATKTMKLYEAKVVDGEGRTVRVRTERSMRSFNWDGSSLMGHTEVEVPEDRIRPDNAAASAALADLLMDRQMLSSPREYAAVRGGRAESVVATLDPDWERAQNENYEMSDGRACVVEAFDDHGKHLASHTSFAKSRRWETLSPEVQATFREHMKGHEVSAFEATGKARMEHSVDPALAATPEVTNISPEARAMLGTPQDAAMKEMPTMPDVAGMPDPGGMA